MSSYAKHTDSLIASVNELLTEKVKVRKLQPVFAPKIKGQCTYSIDFKKKQITHHHGVLEMLGYTADEFNFEKAIDFVHPADSDHLVRLIYAVSDYATRHSVQSDLALHASLRMLKKDGSYIRVLAQSTVHYEDHNGRMTNQYTTLTDISFISTDTSFEWKFEAPDLDYQTFGSYVDKPDKGIFSKRELEVLELVNKGFTSHVIAKKLYLSKHTIDTHRRKMLQKTGCANVIELLEYYRENL